MHLKRDGIMHIEWAIHSLNYISLFLYMKMYGVVIVLIINILK